VTHKNGSYTRCPWTLDGRQEVRVQRHLCHGCGHSYSEASALLVRGSWYARVGDAAKPQVHRCAIDPGTREMDVALTAEGSSITGSK